jgi:hypothetical protein
VNIGDTTHADSAWLQTFDDKKPRRKQSEVAGDQELQLLSPELLQLLNSKTPRIQEFEEACRDKKINSAKSWRVCYKDDTGSFFHFFA